MANFLETLWPDDLPGYIYLWTAHDRVTYSFDNVADAADKALKLNGADVYYGLGVSPKALGRSERCKAADVVAIPGLWADIDVAGPNHKSSGLFKDKEEASAWIRSLPIAPSVIVWSGGGYHIYWLFKEPAETVDYDLSQFTRGWESYLKGSTDRKIDTVSDLARVLRMPGTINHKNDVMCEVVFEDESLRYEPLDFEDYLGGSASAEPPRNAGADAAVKALALLKPTSGADVRVELFKLGERWYCGSYNDWMSVMFCLHHETGGSDEGLELFDDWSAQAGEELYAGSEAIARHWHSIKGYEYGGQVLTWRSVRKWIREQETVDGVVAGAVEGEGGVSRLLAGLAGCESKEDVLRLCGSVRIKEECIWEVEKPIQKRLKAVVGSAPPVGVVRDWLAVSSGGELEELPQWAADWAFLRHPGMFFNRRTGEMITERAFNLSKRAFSVEEQPAELLSRSGVLPVYWNAVYLPGAESEFVFKGCDCVNLFKGWKEHVAVVGDGDREEVWELVLNHARSRYPVKWRILIDYLAWCVQNPGRKVLWMPVLQGVQGDGKSYWGKLMMYVMGEENVSEIRTGEIQSSFTDWAVGYAFGYIEELRISGKNRFETVDNLKPYITNSVIRVVPKGEKGYNAPNVVNFIGFTNYKDAVPVDSRDRRFLPFFSTKQQACELESVRYFEKLYQRTLYDDGGAIVAQRLKDWTVSEEFSVNRCPVIAGDMDKEEMIDLVKTDLRLALEDYIEEGGVIYPKDIHQKFNSAFGGYGLGRVSTSQIKRELGTMGYKVGVRKTVNDGRFIRVWTKGITPELSF